MPQVLKDLEIDEISLVDDGANQHAHIVLVKRKGEGMSDNPVQTVLDQVDALGDKLAKVLEDGGDMSAVQKSLNEFTAALKGKFPFKGGNDPDNDGDDDMAESQDKDKDKGAVTKAQMDSAIAEAVQKALAGAKAETDAAIAKAREEGKKEADAEIAKANKKAEDAAAEVAKMQAENVRKTRIAKLKLDYQNLGFDAEQVEKVYAKLGDDEAKILDGVFKAADEQVAKSKLFQEFGSSAPAPTDGAYGQLVAKAAEIRKSNPKLTDAQAFDEAAVANPTLYAKYKEERSRSN